MSGVGEDGHWRGGWATGGAGRAARGLALMVAGSVAALAALTGVPALAAQEKPELKPIDVVVLVDESGSLGEAGVAAEREATRSVVGSVLPPGSTVEIAGFGSSNAPGQTAVAVRCPQTPVDTGAQRDALLQCAAQLHQRTTAEGNDTDHASALQQAIDTLDDGRADRARVVLLMTDGRLDVSRSERYGDDLGDEAATAAARNAAARDLIADVRGRLDGIGAQVWPLGFGDADLTELTQFPVGRSCATGVPDPVARVITSNDQLTDAILTAYSSASCSLVGPVTPPQPLEPGETVTLEVDVPSIASDANIIVYKVAPTVSVTYTAPDGQVASPNGSGGSVYQFSGQSTDTEVLRIVDPVPGLWRVTLTAPPDIAEVDVRARVVYQGAVSALLTASPPQPAAGEPVEVSMQLRTRRAAVTDPADLSPLTFVAGMTVDGTPSAPQTLTDPDGDGTYTGQFMVPPGARGDVTFTGTVAGPGIGGDQQELFTRVLGAPAALQAQIVLDPGAGTAIRGGELTGSLTVTNNSGAARQVRLEAADPSPGAALTIEPATVDVPAAGATQAFTITVGPDTPVGSAQALLRVLDTADPAVAVAERPVSFAVVDAPTWWDRWWWAVLIAALVVAGVAGYLALLVVRARDRRRVRGLRAELRQGGRPVAELAAPQREFVFPFRVVQDPLGASLQLVNRSVPLAADVFHVRRSGADVSLSTLDSADEILAPGDPRPIGDGLSLVIHSGTGAPAPPTSDDWGDSTDWNDGSDWSAGGSSWAGVPAWSGDGARGGDTRAAPQPSGSHDWAAPARASTGSGDSWGGDSWSGGDSWESRDETASAARPSTQQPTERTSVPAGDGWGGEGAAGLPDQSWPSSSSTDGWNDDDWGRDDNGSPSNRTWS